mmetsp:Transcript_19411/g.56560  ORF Transcript_19411/g.56560 Transcript_19411/m.56560 type:complete len:219 (+) Transcript_19411:1459-2115(+)
MEVLRQRLLAVHDASTEEDGRLDPSLGEPARELTQQWSEKPPSGPPDIESCAQPWPLHERCRQRPVMIDSTVSVHAILSALHNLILVFFLVLLSSEGQRRHGDFHHLSAGIVHGVEGIRNQASLVVVTVHEFGEELPEHTSSLNTNGSDRVSSELGEVVHCQVPRVEGCDGNGILRLEANKVDNGVRAGASPLGLEGHADGSSHELDRSSPHFGVAMA